MIAKLASSLKKDVLETPCDHAFRPAAVLVPLFCDNDDVRILFTKRSETVEVHKGQVAFPGGLREAQDASLVATALRETHEEVGILPTQVEILGALDPIMTPTHFVITPYVGLIQQGVALKANPAEISAIFLAPLRNFLDSKNVRMESKNYFGEEHWMPAFTYEGYQIWGATGLILQQLILLL